MIRIGICDDQPEARDALRFQLEKIIRESSEEIVYEFSTGGSVVRWFRKHPGEIDLLFLDVEMGELSGMEAAAQIRSFDREVMIVFVTGYADYVFDGYKVNALDYVIKPPEAERLRQVLGRVRGMIAAGRERNYCFRNGEGTYRLPLSSISCFCSDKRKVNVVCGERGENPAYSFYGKLDEVERELSGAFVRIHQRYLVNPGQVTFVGGERVIAGGISYPMSRALREEATAKLARAMLGEERGGTW